MCGRIPGCARAAAQSLRTPHKLSLLRPPRTRLRQAIGGFAAHQVEVVHPSPRSYRVLVLYGTDTPFFGKLRWFLLKPLYGGELSPKAGFPGVLSFWKRPAPQATSRTMSTNDGAKSAAGAPSDGQDLTVFVQTLLEQMQSRFSQMSEAIITRIDEMGSRIDDLEKSIADLMEQTNEDGAEKAPEVPNKEKGELV